VDESARAPRFVTRDCEKVFSPGNGPGPEVAWRASDAAGINCGSLKFADGKPEYDALLIVFRLPWLIVTAPDSTFTEKLVRWFEPKA